MTSTPPGGSVPSENPDEHRFGPGGEDSTHDFGPAASWAQQYGDPQPSYGEQSYGAQQYGDPQYLQPQYTDPQQPYGQQSYGAQPPYGAQQPYGQQSYGAQQYGDPQYLQPQYAEPQYAQQQFGGQPYGGAEDYLQGRPAPKPRRAKLLITASAAVVVLAAGGIGTYAALSDSSAGGAGSPQAAVQGAISDLDHSDLVGLLDNLAPAERDALAQPISDTISQLKRNDVLASNADPSNVSGFTFASKDLTYAPNTVTVNDHVQIVQITGGTVTVSGDAAKLPLSKDFLDAVVPGGLHQSQTTTIDIAKELAKDHRTSVRIAAEKVDGQWYPSLFYTVADNATYKRGEPTAADAIPAKGAATPEDAVTTFLQDALARNVDGMVGILSPDEMGVLHDYGHFVIPRSAPDPLGPTISGLTFDSTTLDDGARLLVTKTATITTGTITTKVVRNGDCYSITQAGQSRNVCGGASSANTISALISEFTGRPLTHAQIIAVSDAFSSLDKIGLIVSETGGEWYIDPVRTVVSLVPTVLAGLKPGDLLTLAGLARR